MLFTCNKTPFRRRLLQKSPAEQITITSFPDDNSSASQAGVFFKSSSLLVLRILRLVSLADATKHDYRACMGSQHWSNGQEHQIQRAHAPSPASQFNPPPAFPQIQPNPKHLSEAVKYCITQYASLVTLESLCFACRFITLQNPQTVAPASDKASSLMTTGLRNLPLQANIDTVLLTGFHRESAGCGFRSVEGERRAGECGI